MILATTTVEDFDRFLSVFSTKGAEKRKQHGSKGATVFRDPNEDDRVWMLYDWDEEGLQSFLSDPEVPAIIQDAGYKRRLQPAEFGGQNSPLMAEVRWLRIKLAFRAPIAQPDRATPS